MVDVLARYIYIFYHRVDRYSRPMVSTSYSQRVLVRVGTNCTSRKRENNDHSTEIHTRSTTVVNYLHCTKALSIIGRQSKLCTSCHVACWERSRHRTLTRTTIAFLGHRFSSPIPPINASDFRRASPSPDSAVLI